MTINELLDIRWFIHYVYQTCQNYQVINWNRLDLNDYYVNFYYHSGRVDSKLLLFLVLLKQKNYSNIMTIN